MKKILAAPLLILLSFSGCMKIREEFLVLPDGSGRITLHFAISAKGEAARFTQAELMSGDPDEMEEKVRGLVAKARPTVEEKDGVVNLRMTAYFDDINALKFMDEGEGAKARPKQEFAFRKEGETFVLEIKGNLLADDAPERPKGDAQLEKQREEMFKAMFAGFEFRQDVKLPGRITAVDGFQTKAERTASYVVGEKDLQKPADQKKVNEAVRFRVSCGRTELSDAEIADFKKELEKAKADWVGLRKEMKKNSEGKK